MPERLHGSKTEPTTARLLGDDEIEEMLTEVEEDEDTDKDEDDDDETE
jgi:hypothetical protein